MAFFDKIFGGGQKFKNVNLLSGGQEDLLNQLIQQIMSGSGGFGVDPEFFQKNFVEPALNTFENRTAPQIQQSFIARGLGQSTPTEDALTRAGADVQGQLNQQLAQLLENAQNRKLQASQLALGTKQFHPVGGTQYNPFGQFVSGFAGAAAPLAASSLFGPGGFFASRGNPAQGAGTGRVGYL